MTTPPAEPWEPSCVTGDDDSIGQVRSPGSVGPTDWVRVVPTEFSAFDTFAYQGPDVDRPAPPRMGTFKLDWKTIARRSFFMEQSGLLCDETVLKALQRSGVMGWRAKPLPHASPNPVRGRRLYELDIVGHLGAPSSTMTVLSDYTGEALPFGVAGAATPPVTIDGTSWTGDALCWSEWFKAETVSPMRVLLARGDFVKILAEECDSELLLQPVEVVNLPQLPPPSRPAGIWQPAPRPWAHPTAWSGSVTERIRATASNYRHFLPPPPPREEFERVVDDLEQRYHGKLSADLREFMLSSNGASLFGGMLTFLPIGPRTAENQVPDVIAGDDIAGAHARISDDDWRLKLDPGWILFAARFASFHALWSMNPAGLVRLLSQTGEILGPELPFQAWLEDQVADLEWVWDNPKALGRDRPTWLEMVE